MKVESKTKKVARNTLMGMLNNITLAVLNLFARKLFLNYIGIEYLSIGQIINNILGILAFSELGISNSVLYMLYKPIAENDEQKITRIIGSYRKLNRGIGCIIMVSGTLCIPLLHHFVKTSINMSTVYLIYMLNLIYSAGTYLCSYRQVLINADQKNYIVSQISLIVNFVSILIHCTAIYLTHNYIVYLSITIIMGLLQNIIIFIAAGKMYPFLKKNKTSKLDKIESRELTDNVKSLFSVKVCGIVINNTDNILVSWINTLMVGYCANYTMISMRIKGIISIFHSSIVYSLGIASVEKDAVEKYNLFKKILLVNTFLAEITTILLGVLWNDFIILWLGNQYLISKIVLYSLLLNYMWVIITATIWMFRDTNGLFTYVKKMLLLNAIINLGLSILLGKILGIAGVYYATIVADILTDFWFDARLIYEKIFKRNDYWKYNVYILLNICATIIIIYGIDWAFSRWKVSIIIWLLKGTIASILYIILFVLIYGRCNSMKNIVQMLLSNRSEKWRKNNE